MIKEAFNFANNGDEFYTRINDIAKEIPNYNWSNMTVYFNCGNPSQSNFYKYFKSNFKALGLKRLLSTYYSDNPQLLVYDGVSEKSYPINSGRFQDNSDVIDMCDAVVTNPPFSSGMVMELIDMLMSSGKKFLFVGPLNIITKKKIFDYVNSGALRVGYTSINTYNREDGSKSNAPTCWWTNFNVEKPFLNTSFKYDENMYPRYDNCDAIDCSRTEMIPNDYDGMMGVPVRFITKYNPRQFSLIGILNHPRINGKSMYSRIIIQPKNLHEGIKRVRISESSYRRIFKKMTHTTM